MADIGFTYYDTIPTTPAPTTAEIVASLTAGQRGDVLDAFANKILPQRLKYIGVPKAAAIHLYLRLDAVEEFCRTEVRGERIITPAVIDPETGEVTTPAVYNTVPSSVEELKTAVDNQFSVEFSAAQSGAIVDKMIAYSKHDGTGDAAYYLAQVTS